EAVPHDLERECDEAREEEGDERAAWHPWEWNGGTSARRYFLVDPARPAPGSRGDAQVDDAGGQERPPHAEGRQDDEGQQQAAGGAGRVLSGYSCAMPRPTSFERRTMYRVATGSVPPMRTAGSATNENPSTKRASVRSPGLALRCAYASAYGAAPCSRTNGEARPMTPIASSSAA